MTTLVVTTNLDQPDKVHLGGGRYLVTGELTLDTGDYVSGGIAVTAAQFGFDTIDRVIVGKPSIVRTSAYFIKSTSKVKVFLEDSISGIEAEHGAAAMTAQSIPFWAIGKKAA